MLRITIWIPDFYEFISGEYISGFFLNTFANLFHELNPDVAESCAL